MWLEPSFLCKVVNFELRKSVAHYMPFFSLFTTWWARWLLGNNDNEKKLSIDELSDEEVTHLIDAIDVSKNSLVPPDEHGMRPAIYLAAQDLVAKPVSGDSLYESYMMNWVASQTTIPIPRVGRCICNKSGWWIVMEYVPGADLETIWPTLSFWRKLHIGWLLRGYIQQLRKVKLPNDNIPGPFDGRGTPLICLGRLFTDRFGAGPFASLSEMSAWYMRKLALTVTFEWTCNGPMGLPEPTNTDLVFDDTMPLVMTHGELSMRNIRIGLDGKVWLIDWGFSGAYPKWFEYAALIAYDDRPNLPRLWRWMAPFIAGRYASQRQFITRIDYALFTPALDPIPPPRLGGTTRGT